MGKYIDVENIDAHEYVATWNCNCSEYGRQRVMAIDDINYLPTVDAEVVVRCKNCKFSRPLDRTKSPEKYYRDDCIVCECEDVVGDEPMIYPSIHYCGFGRSKLHI